jgi:hypothetical protein
LYALLLIGAVLKQANNGIINGIELKSCHPINSFFEILIKIICIKMLITTAAALTWKTSFYEHNYD